MKDEQPAPLAGPYTAFTYGDPATNHAVMTAGGTLTAGVGGFAVSAPGGGGGAWTFVS